MKRPTTLLIILVTLFFLMLLFSSCDAGLSLNTAPTTYAKDSKDEDFVISLQYALYDRLYELTNDRIIFLINKFPKLK